MISTQVMKRQFEASGGQGPPLSLHGQAEVVGPIQGPRGKGGVLCLQQDPRWICARCLGALYEDSEGKSHSSHELGTCH